MPTSSFRALALAVVLAHTLGATTFAAGRTAPAAAPTAASVVQIDNFTFGPAALTVPVGATVSWVNRDDIPHTVTAVDGSFRSKVLDTDQTFAFTFAKPGEYRYFCSLHPHMTGTVIVKP